MTKLHVSTFGSLAIVALLASAQTTTPEAKMQTYRDDGLKFSISFPANFALAPKEQTQATINGELAKAKGTVVKGIAECTTAPLNAMRQQNDFSMLIQMTINGNCAGLTFTPDNLSTVAKSALSNSLQRIGPAPTIGEPAAYDLNSHPAQVIFGSVEITPQGSPITLYAAATCTLVSNNDVCWEVISSDKQELHKLLQNEITFDGSKPVPLVSASVNP